MKGIIITAGVLLAVIAAFAGEFISTNNACVRYEKSISAQFEQNKNNYDSYFKKLRETAQVPEMYANDLRKLYDSAMTGRYGKAGSKAMFQWLQEQNPQLDSAVYVQVQRVIESGRNDFETNQKLLIDKKRAYEVVLGEFPSGAVAGMLGYPEIKLDDFKIVTSVDTKAAFKSGESAPLQLRSNQ
jgi:hypothetical protein